VEKAVKTQTSLTCYLCGKAVEGDFSRDHVPPKQFYEEGLRRKYNPNLFWLPVHKSCNKSFQHDEDYFVYSLMPLARGSHAGDSLWMKILDDCKNHPEQATLLRKVVNEFERQPSGLILPDGLVKKRFEGDRILRVAWKIVRGLYFLHCGLFVPDDAPKGCELISPGQRPPDTFFSIFSSTQNHGRHPAVFDYTFKSFPEFHNLNYWAMLLWDRLIMIVKFQFPTCNCPKCGTATEE
jgi:hypothetical protein